MADLQGATHRPESRLTAALHHIALRTPDPGRLADFYEQALGYAFDKGDLEYVGKAPDRRVILTPGAGKTLSHIGFAVSDEAELASLRARLSTAAWPRRDGATRFFEDAVSITDPDGNVVEFGLAPPEPERRSVAQDLPARIQHVVVASRNPEGLIEFYIQVLGFALSDNVTDEDGGLRTSFLRCSRDHHSFAVFKAAENRLDHHCYETTDWNMIRDWCDRMAAMHVPIAWGPGRHGPGNNLFIFIHDPDGNWVELSAELEQVEPDRPVGVWPHAQRTLNSWGQGLLRS